MRDYDYIVKHDDLGRIAQLVSEAEVIGLDIETSKLPTGRPKDALEPRRGVIRLIQLNLDDMHVFVVDLFQTKGPGPLIQAFRDTKAIFVIHGAKFEQKWFWHHHKLELWPVFCTHRASALIYNGKTHLKHGLDTVVERELAEVPVNTGQGSSDWSRPKLSQLQKDYAAEDVIRLPRLRRELRGKLETYGLMYAALIDFGVILAECEAELRGFPLDGDAWTELARLKRIERSRLKEELLYDLPHPTDQMALPGMNGGWNLDSQPQMLKCLRKLGLKQRVEGEMVPLVDTSSLSLAPFAAQHDSVAKLMEYRHVAQRVKAFGLKWLRDLEDDGRVHTQYWALLVSGRYSSAHPNLQQIPREKAYRKCFRTRKGRVFVLADYAGIEMRIIAEVANDGKLIKVFVTGQDAHYATAALVMSKPVGSVTDGERQQAKAVNFGFIYGMQPKKFVVYALGNYGVKLTEREANKFHKRYFENYQGIRVWHNRVTREGKRSGISRTLAGRHRYLDREKSWNEFMNNPIQGCLQAGTLVMTSNGPVAIEKLWGYDESLRVWTGHSWESAKVVNRGSCRLANVHLEDGTVIRCDTRHKMLRVTDAGATWASFEELAEGDAIAKPLARRMDFDAPYVPVAFDSTGPTLPEGCDWEFWYWMGYLLGDGWTHCDGLSYAFGDHEQDRMATCKVFWEATGATVSVRTATHTPCRVASTRHTLTVWSRDLRRGLDAYGFGGSAHTKRVPAGAKVLPHAYRMALIKGVMDSDGTWADPRETNPHVHLCQRPLLEDLKSLLRTVGVESKLRGPYRYKEGTSYRLDIHPAMLREAFDPGSGPRPRVQMPTPREWCDRLVSQWPSGAGSDSDRVLISRLRGGGTTSVYTLTAMASEQGIDLGEIYAHSSISKIEVLDRTEDTFTLAVDHPLHRFEAEGVIHKNTGADALKLSMRSVHQRLQHPKYGDRAWLVHHVHDEIIVECDDDPDTIAAVKFDLEQGMIEGMSPFLKSVPIVVDANHGTDWASAK